MPSTSSSIKVTSTRFSSSLDENLVEVTFMDDEVEGIAEVTDDVGEHDYGQTWQTLVSPVPKR